jgi:hypothetical protein
MWDRSAFLYAAGDSEGIGRQQTRTQIDSTYVKPDQSLLVGAIVVVAVIFLLGRRK